MSVLSAVMLHSWLISITCSKSNADARRGQEALEEKIDQLLVQNCTLQSRMLDVERQLRITQGNSIMDGVDTSSIASGEIARSVADASIEPGRPEIQSNADWRAHEFEKHLMESWVYRRSRHRAEDMSIYGPSIRTGTGSILSTITMSAVSTIAVMKLPVSIAELSGDMWRPSINAWPGSASPGDVEATQGMHALVSKWKIETADIVSTVSLSWYCTSACKMYWPGRVGQGRREELGRETLQLTSPPIAEDYYSTYAAVQAERDDQSEYLALRTCRRSQRRRHRWSIEAMRMMFYARHAHIEAVVGTIKYVQDNDQWFGVLYFPLARTSLGDLLEEISRHNEYFSSDEATWQVHKDAGRMLRYLPCLCQALFYVHSNNMLHGDIKPSNMLIDPSDQSVFLAGFHMLGRGVGTTRMKTSWTVSHANDVVQDVISLGFVYMAVITVAFGETLEAFWTHVNNQDPQSTFSTATSYNEALSTGRFNDDLLVGCIDVWVNWLLSTTSKFPRRIPIEYYRGFKSIRDLLIAVSHMMQAYEPWQSSPGNSTELLERTRKAFNRLSLTGCEHCRVRFE